MNKRREGNRAKSEKVSSANTSSTRGEHDYGKGHDSVKAYGSHASFRSVKGPGPQEGAGEVYSGAPGAAARKVNQGSDSVKFLGAQDMYKGGKEKTPKGMSRIVEGE